MQLKLAMHNIVHLQYYNDDILYTSSQNSLGIPCTCMDTNYPKFLRYSRTVLRTGIGNIGHEHVAMLM